MLLIYAVVVDYEGPSAAFSKQEDAEKYIEKFNLSGSHHIEELPFDLDLTKDTYIVELVNGKITSAYKTDSHYINNSIDKDNGKAQITLQGNSLEEIISTATEKYKELTCKA